MDLLLDSGPWFLLDSSDFYIIMTNKEKSCCNKHPGQKSPAVLSKDQIGGLPSIVAQDSRLGSVSHVFP